MGKDNLSRVSSSANGEDFFLECFFAKGITAEVHVPQSKNGAAIAASVVRIKILP